MASEGANLLDGSVLFHHLGENWKKSSNKEEVRDATEQLHSAGVIALKEARDLLEAHNLVLGKINDFSDSERSESSGGEERPKSDDSPHNPNGGRHRKQKEAWNHLPEFLRPVEGPAPTDRNGRVRRDSHSGFFSAEKRRHKKGDPFPANDTSLSPQPVSPSSAILSAAVGPMSPPRGLIAAPPVVPSASAVSTQHGLASFAVRLAQTSSLPSLRPSSSPHRSRALSRCLPARPSNAPLTSPSPSRALPSRRSSATEATMPDDDGALLRGAQHDSRCPCAKVAVLAFGKFREPRQRACTCKRRRSTPQLLLTTPNTHTPSPAPNHVSASCTTSPRHDLHRAAPLVPLRHVAASDSQPPYRSQPSPERGEAQAARERGGGGVRGTARPAGGAGQKRMIEVYGEHCAREQLVPMRLPLYHDPNHAPSDTVLALASYGMGDRKVCAVADGVKEDDQVISVELGDNRLTGASMNAIVRALGANGSIASLDLASNRLDNNACKHLAAALTSSHHLTHLSLQDNKLTGGCMDHVRDALATNTTLTHLDLSKNALGERGAAGLAQVLPSNTALRCLLLSWNQIRGRGAAALARCLAAQRSIQQLDLSWNGFSDPEALHLAQSLRINTVLTSVDVSHNALRQDGCVALHRALQLNTALRHLCCDSNPLTRTGAEFLLRAVDKAAQRGLHRDISFAGCSLDELGEGVADDGEYSARYVFDLSDAYHRLITTNLLRKAVSTTLRCRWAGVVSLMVNSRPVQPEVLLSNGVPTGGVAHVDYVHLPVRPKDGLHDATLHYLAHALARAPSPAVLAAASNAFYFTTIQVQQLLEVRPDDDDDARIAAISYVFARVLDRHKLNNVVAAMGTAQQRKLRGLLGPLYYLDAVNPTGHYVLHLHNPYDRHLALYLQELNNAHILTHPHAPDTSQNADRHIFRNASLDDSPYVLKGDTTLPHAGVLCFDFVALWRPRPSAHRASNIDMHLLLANISKAADEAHDIDRHSVPRPQLNFAPDAAPASATPSPHKQHKQPKSFGSLPDDEFPDALQPPPMHSLCSSPRFDQHNDEHHDDPSADSPSVDGTETPSERRFGSVWQQASLREVSQLRALRTESAALYFSIAQLETMLALFSSLQAKVECVVALYSRVLDLQQLWPRVVCPRGPAFARRVVQRLGVLNLINPALFHGHYHLDARVCDERVLISMLASLAHREHHALEDVYVDGEAIKSTSAWSLSPPLAGAVSLTYTCPAHKRDKAVRTLLVKRTLFATIAPPITPALPLPHRRLSDSQPSTPSLVSPTTADRSRAMSPL